MPFSNKEKQKEYQREYQKKRRRRKSPAQSQEEGASNISPEVKISIIITLLMAMAVLSVLSFFDLSGPFGLYSSNIIRAAFGWGAYIFPVLLIAVSYVLFKGVRYELNMWQIGGAVLLFLSLLGIMHHTPNFSDPFAAAKNFSGGGLLGFSIIYVFVKIVGYWGAWVFLAGISVVGGLLSFSSAIFRGGNEEGEYMDSEEESSDQEERTLFGAIKEKLDELRYKNKYNKPEEEISFEKQPTAGQESAGDVNRQGESEEERGEGVVDEDFEPEEPPKKAKRNPIKIPLNLLEGGAEKPSAENIEAIKDKIEKTFATFGIHVEMDEVNIGPSVTQYTLKPPDGVKLSRITGLASELSLALAAHPLRMEAPIPGKSLVGIEIPNQTKAVVKLKESMQSSAFKKRKSNLSICLGKDVSGKPWVTDLSKMPHLLIAGATGSGKSVAINSIIVSLMYQNSPSDLNFVLVDPKKVELSAYNDIPYLCAPVITDNKKTINALKWVVNEMDRRYQLFLQEEKKTIDSYNESNKDDKIPHIVFVIDELADLMAVAASDVEGAIVRLAQMARAVGIHLVIATQRPSVNVITGLIKANIPSRIAFAVPSQVDSRTILDSSGAEKLLGQGDMLFSSSDANKPHRLQGAFLNEEEIERVVNCLKEQGEVQYQDEITDEQRGVTVLGGDVDDDAKGDDLYDQAREVVVNSGKASASFLQRRLSVGYSRAARLLDSLESEGVIGPANGAKPREILISSESENEVEDENTSEYETDWRERDENENF